MKLDQPRSVITEEATVVRVKPKLVTAWFVLFVEPVIPVTKIDAPVPVPMLISDVELLNLIAVAPKPKEESTAIVRAAVPPPTFVEPLEKLMVSVPPPDPKK